MQRADALRRHAAKGADPRVAQLQADIARLQMEASLGLADADPKRVEHLAQALRRKRK
jgi:hypothetical protein